MFTYDADMEWDAGQPWYRPTRINHVIIGGEYGWRWGTGKWPPYYEDSLPSTLDMGLGSPTGMEFVGGSAFPPRFQKSMLVADWQNGRILAVDMLPKGASYQCRYEVLLEGGPLNVCDMEFGPDGALYFITGGRGSQSGLYRVTVAESNQPAHPGPTIQPTLTPEELSVASADADVARHSRVVRRQLEGVLFSPESLSLDEIWPHLNSEDRWLRFAARTALERKDVASYKTRVLAESRPHAAIAGLIAVCRQGDAEDATEVLTALSRIDTKSLDQQQLLGLLRAYELCFIRLGKPDSSQTKSILGRLRPLYPTRSASINHMLCELLVYLGDDEVVARTVARLNGDITQEEQIRSARTLVNATAGWTPEAREAYVGWLAYARGFQGGRQLTERIRDIRTDFEAGLSAPERERLQPWLTKLDQPLEDGLVQDRPIVERWKMDMLADTLATAELGRSFENGQRALLAANCLKCHRIGSAGGQIGPDLSAVGRRFDTRTILESILEPSRVMDPKYRHTAYVLTTGKVVTGRPVGVSKSKITVETDPLRQTTVEIIRSDIEEAVPATVSPMPSGLADVLTREELFDLLAYLKAGGDPDAPVFQPVGAGN